MKICFHVDEETRWKTCLGNVYNTLKYLNEHQQAGDVLVVVNAAAVKQLTSNGADEAGFLDELKDYLRQGVQIKACENALRGYQIDEKDLVEGILIVPAAIIELVERQNEGYAYIRP